MSVFARFGPPGDGASGSDEVIDLTMDTPPPSPPAAAPPSERAYGCGLGERGVPPEIMARIDFDRFLAICRDEANDQSATTIPNGKRPQYHLDESAEGTRLLHRVLDKANPDDHNRRYRVVWGELIAALRGAVAAQLRGPPFHFTEAFARDLQFSGCSLIVQDADESASPQAPHTDFAGGLQCIMACTEGAVPTSVYTGAYGIPNHDAMRRSAAERQLHEANVALSHAAEEGLATLAATPRAHLLASMRPAAERALRRGEFCTMWGPVIHAGPAIPRGTRRIVLFITAHPAGAPPYDINEQHSPANAALTVRSAELAVERVLEYSDFDLTQTEDGETGHVLRVVVERRDMTPADAVQLLRLVETEFAGDA